MSPFLQRPLPSPRSPEAKSSGAPAAASAMPGARRLAGRGSQAAAGLGLARERGRTVPGQGELGERPRAGLHSPREAALLGEAVVYFVPEVTASGFASALELQTGSAESASGPPEGAGAPSHLRSPRFFLCRLYSL